MNRILRNLLFFLPGLLLLGAIVPIAQKLAAQSSSSSPQTRIYIPWISGSDAGYTTLLMLQNTSLDPYGTTPSVATVAGTNPPAYPTTAGAGNTCTADAYYGGNHYGPGTLPPINPGSVNVFTEAQIATATGVTLANSGQRAYLFLTCNFKFAHAQALLVNPGGAVTFIPGYIVAPNRSLSAGPEQLLQ